MSPFYFMKKIFFILSILVSVGAVGQLPSKGYFRYDSVYFEKIGGNSEFILRNSTRSVTNGVLTNLGNGRTGFVAPTGLFTASNGITKVVNDFQLGGTLSAYTRIIGGNNVFEFTGMGYGSRFTATPRTGGTMGTMTFSNSNGTDSAFLNIQGRTAGASNREIHFGINHTGTGALMELYFKNLVGTAPYAALTYSDPTRNTYVFVDSTRTYLSKQLSGTNRSTGLDLHNDSSAWYYGGAFAARTSEMLIRNGYQDSWATDSVRWRLGDRSASLTFNSDGWHAWQTAGEYYFYNVARETDSTGLDFLVYDRADQEMKRFPSDLFWGAGGSTPTLDQVMAAGSTLTTSRTITGTGSSMFNFTSLDEFNVNAAGNSHFDGGTFTFDTWLTAADTLQLTNIEGFHSHNDSMLVWSPSRQTVGYRPIPSGGGTPGGSDTHVQFNDGGAFGGDAGMTFNKTSNELTVAGQSFFGAGLSISGTYSTNAGMNLDYVPGSNLGRIVMYDGGYKNFEVIAQEVRMYGGGSNPGLLINGSGNTAVGTTTAADATSNLTVKGSFATAYAAKTTTYPITATDHTLEATSGTFTMTLPLSTGCVGRQYVITNSGSGVLTLATTSSETFRNVTGTPITLTLNQFSTVTVVSANGAWLRTSSL